MNSKINQEVVLLMLNDPPNRVIGGNDGSTYDVSRMAALIKYERYQFYLETEKLILYKIDAAKRLKSFYEITKRILPKIVKEAEKNTIELDNIERRIDLKEYQEIKMGHLPFEVVLRKPQELDRPKIQP